MVEPNGCFSGSRDTGLLSVLKIGKHKTRLCAYTFSDCDCVAKLAYLSDISGRYIYSTLHCKVIFFSTLTRRSD